MKRQSRAILSWILIVSTVATGCAPQQPFYCREDGDLSHYLDVATDIEYPDVEEPSLCEVQNTLAPLTLKNMENYEIWDLPLSEVVHITLCNSQVMRQAFVQRFGAAPDTLSRTLITPGVVQTSYDPALTETVTGLSVGSPFQGSGPEAALSEFDAQLDASVFWEKNRRPQNRVAGIDFAPPIFAQDLGTFTSGITKTTAVGTHFGIRNNTNYDGNNTSTAFRPLISEWNTNFEASFAHPLLQGSGAQYNRIAGPFGFQQYASGIGNPIDGVMIARASLAKPWLFRQAAAALRGEPVPPDPTLEEERQLLLHHFNLICKRFGEAKGALLMRKYACCYAQGRRGAREFRSRVVLVTTPVEFRSVVETYFPS